MQKTKITKEGGLYLFQGKSSANSHFIEDAEEAKMFFKMANTYLDKYLKVMEFSLKDDGWQLLVRLRSKLTIINNYEKDRSKSKVAKGPGYTEVWRIISERIRILRFQYVRWSNKKEGRTGTKVACNYERFIIDDENEARQIIENMREGNISLSQNLEYYRPEKSRFDKDNQIEENKMEMTSKNIQANQVFEKSNWVKSLYLWDVTTDVLHKLVTATLKLHFDFLPINNHLKSQSSIMNR